MKFAHICAGLALAMVTVPAAVLADDPNDPEMQDPAARARDAAMIRKLNQDMLAQVRARDAAQAQGWQSYKDYPARRAEYEAAMARYRQSQTQFADSRSQYDADMAAWRHAVEMCRSGAYEYCQR